MNEPIKSIIGHIIIYFVFILYIPYFLFINAHNTLFLTYFANVDIVSNILSINFPSYFKNVYDISPQNVYQYISFNIISLVALSGIFIRGIGLKNKGTHNDISILMSLVLMSIITWTLPTQLIPYLTNKVKTYFKISDSDKTYDILITTIISLTFIVLEGMLIHLLVDKNKLFRNNKYIQNINFDI